MTGYLFNTLPSVVEAKVISVTELLTQNLLIRNSSAIVRGHYTTQRESGLHISMATSEKNIVSFNNKLAFPFDFTENSTTLNFTHTVHIGSP